MGPKTTTQKTSNNQTVSPWGPAAEYFPDLYSRGAEALDATNSTPYGGNFFATPTAAQRSGVDMLKASAGGMDAGVPSLRAMADRIAGGEFLDVANNPLFKSAAEAAIAPVTQQLHESWLPGIQDQAIARGAYGGGAQDKAEGMAVRQATDAASRATTGLASSYYGIGAGMTPYAAPMYGAANELAKQPAMTTGLAGTQEQQWDQTVLDNELKKWEMQQGAPWQGLNSFANLLTAGGFRNQVGSGTSETTTPAPDLATMILQGGLGGLSLLSGGATALPGIMGAAGSLGSIFSPKPNFLPQPGTAGLMYGG